MNRKTLVFLVSVSCFAFLLRATPHLFVIPFLGTEEGSLVYFCYRVLEGDFRYVAEYPHLPIFIIAGLSWVTGVPVWRVATLWNPLVSALTVPLVYLLVRKLGGSELQALFGSLLFACLDVHVYRTTLLSGSEGFGIFLMFVFLNLYLTRKWLSFLVLPVLFTVHLLPLGMSILFVFIDQFVVHKPTRKTVFQVGLALTLTAIIVNVYFPYRLASYRLFHLFEVFNPQNYLTLYNIEDLKTLLSTMTGTLLVYGWSIVFRHLFGEKKEATQLFCLCLAVCLALSFPFYSTVISPYRILVYIGIFGALNFALAFTGEGHKIVTVWMCVLMLSQITGLGWNVHNHIYYAPTREELEAVMWLKNRNSTIRYYNIGWDHVGMETLVVLFPHHGENPFAKKNHTLDLWYPNLQGLETPHTQYIIYSDRLKQNALFRVLTNRRVLYTPVPINDKWKNNPEWQPIYNQSGVIIYERSRT